MQSRLSVGSDELLFSLVEGDEEEEGGDCQTTDSCNWPVFISLHWQNWVSKWDIRTFSSCDCGDQTGYLKPNHDLFQTLIKTFWCLNLTRPLPQLLHHRKVENITLQCYCCLQKCTMPTFVLGIGFKLFEAFRRCSEKQKYILTNIIQNWNSNKQRKTPPYALRGLAVYFISFSPVGSNIIRLLKFLSWKLPPLLSHPPEPSEQLQGSVSPCN